MRRLFFNETVVVVRCFCYMALVYFFSSFAGLVCLVLTKLNDILPIQKKEKKIQFSLLAIVP